jgi:hypothetical protein
MFQVLGNSSFSTWEIQVLTAAARPPIYLFCFFFICACCSCSIQQVHSLIDPS